jgi:hypothetical protein
MLCNFNLVDLMAQNYLCSGDIAKGIIAKILCRFCQKRPVVIFADIFV